jgi:hypothetical protein
LKDNITSILLSGPLFCDYYKSKGDEKSLPQSMCYFIFGNNPKVCAEVPQALLSKTVQMVEDFCNASVHQVPASQCNSPYFLSCQTDNHLATFNKMCGEEFSKNFTRLCDENESPVPMLVWMVVGVALLVIVVSGVIVLCDKDDFQKDNNLN